MVVVLDDRREMSLPLSLYPTLLKASPAQRAGVGTGRAGEGLPLGSCLDLDLSVDGLLQGLPEAVPPPPRPRRAVRRVAGRPRPAKGKR